MRKSIVVIVAFVFTAVLLPQGAVGFSQDRPTGRLTLYGSTQEMAVRHVVQAFERDTYIKVRWIRMSTGETLSRLRAERRNPQASIWFAGPGTAHVVAADEGLLEPYASPRRSLIAPEHQDPNGYWAGVFYNGYVFASNPKILAERKLQPPTSYADLLRPEWHKQFAVSNPATSGTAFLFVASLVQLMGEDAAFRYFRDFNRNVFQYPKSGIAPAQMASRGEIAMGITMLGDTFFLIKEGHNLIITVPKEGVGFSLEPVSIVKGAPEPVDARAFVDWVLGPRGQAAIYEIFPYPSVVGTNPQARPARKAIDVELPYLKGFDTRWMAKHYDRLIERFQNEILQK